MFESFYGQISSSGFWVLGSGFLVLGFKFRVLGSGPRSHPQCGRCFQEGSPHSECGSGGTHTTHTGAHTHLYLHTPPYTRVLFYFLFLFLILKKYSFFFPYMEGMWAMFRVPLGIIVCSFQGVSGWFSRHGFSLSMAWLEELHERRK